MIPFTQYMRPGGRRKAIEFSHYENVELAARELIARGLRFEAEVLNDGPVWTVSLTVTNGEEDVAIELSENGEAISNAVVRLIQSAICWCESPEGKTFFARE